MSVRKKPNELNRDSYGAMREEFMQVHTLPA